MQTTDRGLERVQHLYLMQIQLIDLLEGDLSDPEIRKQVRKTMKEFEALLAKADARYMGGEDVMLALRSIPSEIDQRLKTSAGERMKKKRQRK